MPILAMLYQLIMKYILTLTYIIKWFLSFLLLFFIFKIFL